MSKSQGRNKQFFAFYARSRFSRQLVYSSVNNISNVRILSFCSFSRRILPQSTIHHLQSRARFQYSFAVSFSPVEHGRGEGKEGAQGEWLARAEGPGDFWEFSCVCDPARLRGWINKFNGACHVAKRDKFRASDSHLKQCRREYTPFVTRCFCFTLLFIPLQPPCRRSPSCRHHSTVTYSISADITIVRPIREPGKLRRSGTLVPGLRCRIHASFFIPDKNAIKALW